MDILKDKFKIISTSQIKNGLTKIAVAKSDLKNCLSFLKNSSEFSADMLISIVAIDWIDRIELIYDVFSSKLIEHKIISVMLDSGNYIAESVTSVYKSAAFDEREIFDLFGVEFEGHKELKRLLMPNSTVGNPLLKSYSHKDERLAWNE